MHEQAIKLRAGGVTLAGDLQVPAPCAGLVLFAHGSGSSRHSPRNRFVARFLNRAGLGTLLLDLLTREEEAEDLETGALRFDIGLLSARLIGAADWAAADPGLCDLPAGFFGASTGAAAALTAAAERPGRIRAVVSRGGRPDLAAETLSRVHAPSLFIVGGEDRTVLRFNRTAMELLLAGTERQLAVIPGATHLFEEPGALEQVADLAQAWFQRHFAACAPNAG